MDEWRRGGRTRRGKRARGPVPSPAPFDVGVRLHRETHMHARRTTSASTRNESDEKAIHMVLQPVPDAAALANTWGSGDAWHDVMSCGVAWRAAGERKKGIVCENRVEYCTRYFRRRGQTPIVHAGGTTESLANEPAIQPLRVVGAKACLEFLIIRCVVTSPTAHPRGCLLFRTLILGERTRGADRDSPNKPDERYETQRAEGHVGPHSHGVALNGDFQVLELNMGRGWQESSDGTGLCTRLESGCGRADIALAKFLRTRYRGFTKN